MPPTPVWLAAVESVLNRSIGQSMQAAAAANRLNRTTLQIEIEGIYSIRIAVSTGRLALTAGGGDEADACISGPPLALLDLMRDGVKGGRRAAAQIRGDAEIASRYRELIALARPDLEEELSRLVGDVPARRLSQFAKAAFGWVRKTGRTAGENLAEYLQEESRDLISKPELEEFLQGVDQLRETADRVDARLARVEQRLKGTA